MNYVFQALTALFAIIGLFETLWSLIMLFTRRATKGQPTRILIKTNEHVDPAFLAEDLHLLSDRLSHCNDLRIWLICPKKAPQERICRFVAERDESVRVVTEEQLQDEIKAFTKDL